VTAPGETSSKPDPLPKEALAWVIRLHSGQATTDDADAIQQWRQTSPEHEQAFRDAVKLWRTLGDAARDLVAPENPQSSQSLLTRSRQLVMSRRGVLGGAIAASLVGYSVVSPPLGLWPSYQEFAADYRTTKGERRDVALSNNVSLKLNTQTSIAVHAVQNDPRIELISGEATITSAGHTSRPLVVKAANGQVTAMRAQFNARCLSGNVAISCVDGTVTVEVGSQHVALSRGEQVSYNSEGLGSPAALDVEQATAWQNGLLIVRNRALSEVVEEVNRYRPGRIVIVNSRLGRRMITGTFHVDQMDDFIGQVRGLFGASVQSLPGGLVLLS
jgi:transmembrane sensor